MNMIAKALAVSALFATAISCATPVKAEVGDRRDNWVVVTEEDNITVLIEVDSMMAAINTGASYRTVWFRYETLGSDVYSLARIQFDCPGQRYAIKNFSSYKNDKHLGTEKNPFGWDDIVPDTRIKTLSTYACYEPNK